MHIHPSRRLMSVKKEAVCSACPFVTADRSPLTERTTLKVCGSRSDTKALGTKIRAFVANMMAMYQNTFSILVIPSPKRVQTGHHLCWTRFVLLPEKLTPSELTDSISGNGASRTKGQKTFVTGPTTVLQNIFSLLVAPSRKRA